MADEKKKVRIVSDGTPSGTRVEGPDGQPIPGVVSVSWSVEMDEMARPTIELINVDIDAQALAEQQPLCLNCRVKIEADEATIGADIQEASR